MTHPRDRADSSAANGTNTRNSLFRQALSDGASMADAFVQACREAGIPTRSLRRDMDVAVTCLDEPQTVTLDTVTSLLREELQRAGAAHALERAEKPWARAGYALPDWFFDVFPVSSFGLSGKAIGVVNALHERAWSLFNDLCREQGIHPDMDRDAYTRSMFVDDDRSLQLKGLFKARLAEDPKAMAAILELGTAGRLKT